MSSKRETARLTPIPGTPPYPSVWAPASDWMRCHLAPSEGAKWHLIQSLAGDQTDGYGGVPGIGIKRAEALFKDKGYTWKAVVEAFTEKDLSEEEALVNARLAKILTVDDYDFKNKRPILWNPRADYKIDDGAGLETKSAA